MPVPFLFEHVLFLIVQSLEYERLMSVLYLFAEHVLFLIVQLLEYWSWML